MTDDSAESGKQLMIGKLLCVVSIVYVGLFGLSFYFYPIAQIPVLDARENLAWAEQIRSDSLAEEPLYRALLYPFVLSFFGEASLPGAAVAFGFLCHLLNALLVAGIGLQLWKHRFAALFAFILYANYPVALYFAGQVLDVTFSTTLFLAALWLGLASSEASGRKQIGALALLGGLLAGAAVLARPNFLPAVLFLPVIPLIGGAGRRWSSALLLASGLGLMLLLQGVVNVRLSGEFRLTPWQGSYNLFAANRDGANGKYYSQRVSFSEIPAGSNPTRMESELLYREAFGPDAPLEVEAMNAYWKASLREEIMAAPFEWMGLMVRKVFYLFNDWEQYNNTTYSFHKDRLPLLNWNPLGWGLLLILGVWGLVLGRHRLSRSHFYGLGLVGLAYTAGILLFFVSARFRLPLVPLLCVAAGGCVFVRAGLRDGRATAMLLGAGISLAVLSFGNWFNARDKQSFVQDEILLARANSGLGRDAQALALARAALVKAPEKAEIRRIEVTSLFNLWLETRTPEDWAQLKSALEALEVGDASTMFIRGVVRWRESEFEPATQVWQQAVRDFGARAGSSAAALRVVDPETEGVSSGFEQSIRELLQH